MQDEPDRDLLRRFAQGDREAFEALFRQFEREVYRWILRIVREPENAEDALIEDPAIRIWRATSDAPLHHCRQSCASSPHWR